MKQCTYCGKDYPDETKVCAIDSQPLETIGQSQSVSSAAAVGLRSEIESVTAPPTEAKTSHLRKGPTSAIGDSILKAGDGKVYYATAKGRGGPVAFDELRNLAVAGTITRRDKVWCQGMSEWDSADRMPGLFADLPPDLETEAVQSPAIALRPGAWFTEFVNQCSVVLRRTSQHVDLKTGIRMILAVLFALVALELLTGAFEIRTRLGEAAREHWVVSLLAVLLLLGTLFKSRRILVRFSKFVISEDRRPPSDNRPPRPQPWWSAFLLLTFA